MKATERAWRIGSDFAGVLPRAYRAVAGSGGRERDVGRLGEVLLDELALTGMTLTAPPPKLERLTESCRAAADELSGLGVRGAHRDPNPLRVSSLRRRRFGRLCYDQMTFRHDPQLPQTLAAEGLGGPATAVVHLCRQGDDTRPWLVWVHGAGQGQPLDLLFSRARRIRDELGFNIALPVQPGHGARRSTWPPYPNMDPLANVAGMMRVVSEVRALVRWLQPQASAVAVSGVSMGSPVAALVGHLEDIDAVAVYTPIFGLNAMIAGHLGRWGPSVRDTVELLQSDVVAKLTSAVDYHTVSPSPPPQRRLIVGAWHDQMAGREPALALHERWGGQLYWHPGSHVGHLFARGVQSASERFLSALVESAGRV
ncbi:alpha/beta hydrolase [Mycolicibacterium holsaticum]|uniref:alpha/beta hydrolase n=1 Tax=Mycolicibacterium holsaticum TaxID=152142 RepID=UPI001C7D7014|nr:alpha/beta hydrolase [Mycolicibacterium holsaticum]MDA4110326.1 esterase [Mycolicibacterium holsaticum DSM 44478 = JCM 12374]QZA11089.1 alpha/beta hydrolase [Mycolicibacterium holsaticum DSM 44478 = JCM 12374]UNC11417.1 alpha/beta hydrolase [Mycolicibacterium holsaticum DSM 44478 = JCM 12374]